MGCVHGKCCTQYPNSSRGDKREIHENGDNNIHPNGNHEYTESSSALIVIPSHKYKLEYCALTQRGYYPDSPDKENQDSFCVRTRMLSNPNLHFFGVFDGHGQFGTQCSHFVRDRLVEILSEDPVLIEDPVKAYESAFLAMNSELHDSDIDDSMSGTTAITVLVCEDILFIGNVGDSRAVLGVKNGDRVIAEDLSSDQTPFRKDEYERVKLCGARVLSVDQVEGVKDPDIQAWGDEESDGGDPPRLWVQNGMYPGTAFTRSVGDSTAEKIGVVAVPEVSMVRLTPEHLFFVIASDGVFEFLSSQAVVDTVLKYSDPKDACAAIARESYKLWLEHENRTDDISIIIVRIKDLHNNNKSEQEWRAILSPEQFRILRQKGTESPGTGEYNKFSSDGIYNCAGCGTPLYKATTKFNSGCGWPAFFDGLPGAITRTGDRDGRRIEITCTACGGHLGHVFKGEGFNTPTDERHCVNSVSLKFIPEST